VITRCDGRSPSSLLRKNKSTPTSRIVATRRHYHRSRTPIIAGWASSEGWS
jgi:hypothetical protein